jgi:ATP-dependent Clp protease ATP-binding subunit ClpA
MHLEHTPEAVRTLSRALARAARLGHPATGTEHLLFALLDAGTPTARALAPGVNDAGALMGTIAALDPPDWISGDDDVTEPDGDADRHVTAVLREAEWSAGSRARPAVPASPALWNCLRGALVHAEQTGVVTSSHFLVALLGLPHSRAVEALRLRRVDRDTVAAAIDRSIAEFDLSAVAPEATAVAILRRSGAFGHRTGLVTRWLSRMAGHGSPVLFAVRAEALRQAVRRGRSEVDSADLLLGVLSLDHLLVLAGRKLATAANTGAETLTAQGIDLCTLVRSAVVDPPEPLGESLPTNASARRALTKARLLATDQNAPEVGTAHLVSALLDEPDGPVAALLTAAGHDVPRLRDAVA